MSRDSLIVLIGACEIIGLHGVPAKCVTSQLHYNLKKRSVIVVIVIIIITMRQKKNASNHES